MRDLSYDELRAAYKIFLHNKIVRKQQLILLIRNLFTFGEEGGDFFMRVVDATNFEVEAKDTLLKALTENSAGHVNSFVSGSLSHLRRLRLFLFSDDVVAPTMLPQEQSTNRIITRKK